MDSLRYMSRQELNSLDFSVSQEIKRRDKIAVRSFPVPMWVVDMYKRGKRVTAIRDYRESFEETRPSLGICQAAIIAAVNKA